MAKLVNWHDFSEKLKAKRILIFSQQDTRRLFGVSRVSATFLLYRYAKKGFIARIKRGLYTFSDSSLPDVYIAYSLYNPSYISREFALSYHRVIPENVYEITSVTPKSTRRFERQGKIFSYRHIKLLAFTGYTTEKQKGVSFLVADPEKAFVDANYFRLLDHLKPLSRFAKEKINPTKAIHYAKLFENKLLERIITTTLR